MLTTELDFQDRMIDALEANCDLFAQISVPIIPANSDGTPANGIAFMLTPIGQATCNYDGQWDKQYAFQITVRHTDQLTAVNTLQAISRYVDGLDNDSIQSQNGSFYFINGQVTSLPNFLMKDDHGVVYVASYSAELLLNE
ncbi:minor capsid protein [Sporolactobacillus sp. CQH2019]|uniref:phage tail terminator protein n=1 Tax=Sporolactobacillus sp. CQH2019 TaxID=3023512 RepID=UPI002367826E|nr:minor capsid protein [Sporolactobacillus sp. CQH2019]MDD9147826.1 minor capsid protein [Sporolactobacillus sp. CQH2019]